MEDFIDIKIQMCKNCVNYNQPSCPFYNMTKPTTILSDYGINCFQSEEDKMLCDMMCGEAEDEY